MRFSRRTLSLESKLPLMVGGVLLIVISALALVTYTLGADAERSTAWVRLDREASLIAGRLNAGIRGTLVHGRTAAAAPEVHQFLRSPAADTRTAAERVLAYAGPRPEIVLAIEVLDIAGRRVQALGAESESVPRLSIGDATAAQATGFGLIYGIKTLPAFPAVAQVRSDGEPLGWVVVWWHLAATARSQQGSVYVGSPPNQTWTDLSTIIPPPGPGIVAAGSTMRYDRDGASQLASAAAVPETSWLVLVDVPESAVLATTHRLFRRVAAFALVVFAIACVAVWFISRRITRPLRRLTQVADAISSGDYSSRAGVSGHDEVGRLAGAFDHMAARVQSAHEALRAIVDEAPVAVYSLDNDGIVRSWNPAAERIFGWTAEESIGQPLHTLPLESTEERLARIRRITSGVHLKGAEFKRVKKDGSSVIVRVYSGPMHDASGAVTGAMVVAADITELRRLEQQYRHAQKMEAVGRLAGGVAHDFNNLLTVILGETEMALQDIEATNPSRASLEEIGRAGHRASQLTRQLLSFSRQQIVEPTTFDLNDLVRDVERMLDRLIGEDVQLQVRLAGEPVIVRADRSQIEQLVINLAVNARDAMPLGGLLTIELSSVQVGNDDSAAHSPLIPGDYCLLTVNDSGVGMSEEVRSHIFEPFFTTKGPGRGTGLGLATCYGIVTQAGGHIEVYSEPGVGSSFKVFLPRARAVDIAPQAGPRREASAGNEHILLVEDQVAVRDIAARMLTSLGYQVTTAEDGETALRVLRSLETPVDLLLTDVVLPGINGRDLADQARAMFPHLKVLFASGYTGDVAAYQALVDANAALIQKPFSVLALGERVRQVLDS